jgi:protein-disulfide isomerase
LANRFAVVSLVATALLAGCTGDVPVIGGPKITGPAATALEGGATPDTPRFNPFSDALETATAAREVIANPTVADIMQAGELPEMTLGRPDAPVTIVQYASLSCPYSRRFQLETFPALKREYIDTGKVRFILREFPIGKQSGLATIALRCAVPGKYFTLYDKFMAEQASWVSQEVRADSVYDVAAQVGLTRPEFDRCREDQRLIAQLNWVKERGLKLGVIGTPNFFVQGRLIKKVIGMKDIRGIVDPIIAGGNKASLSR